MGLTLVAKTQLMCLVYAYNYYKKELFCYRRLTQTSEETVDETWIEKLEEITLLLDKEGQFIDQLLTGPEQLIDSDRIQDHDTIKHANALINVVETGMSNYETNFSFRNFRREKYTYISWFLSDSNISAIEVNSLSFKKVK